MACKHKHITAYMLLIIVITVAYMMFYKQCMIAHYACPTFLLASYAFKMSLKNIFNLVSAAEDMLAGCAASECGYGTCEMH